MRVAAAATRATVAQVECASNTADLVWNARERLTSSVVVVQVWLCLIIAGIGGGNTRATDNRMPDPLVLASTSCAVLQPPSWTTWC